MSLPDPPQYGYRFAAAQSQRVANKTYIPKNRVGGRVARTDIVEDQSVVTDHIAGIGQIVVVGDVTVWPKSESKWHFSNNFLTCCFTRLKCVALPMAQDGCVGQSVLGKGHHRASGEYHGGDSGNMPLPAMNAQSVPFSRRLTKHGLPIIVPCSNLFQIKDGLELRADRAVVRV